MANRSCCFCSFLFFLDATAVSVCASSKSSGLEGTHTKEASLPTGQWTRVSVWQCVFGKGCP